MNYEEKLRETINSNSEYYPSKDKAVFEKYFPELKESKDERIRKEMLIYLDWLDGRKDYAPKGIYNIKDMISWLEKQGNKSVNIDVESMVSLYEQRLKSQGGTKYSPLANMRLTAFRHGVENVLEELNLKKLEKQGGQKSAFEMKTPEESLGIDSDTYNKIVDECIYGEQKPTDDVEPKFKVGDWVVNNVCFPMQIASTKDGMYIFTKGDAMSVSFVDEHLHLWSIQDAEDGDVLVNWNNTTFIFKAIEDETVKFHIAYNEKWDTIKTPLTKLSHLGLPEPQFEFHLATKEQRDLLFSKMKEAGYEWDSEKKELKKIEPKTLDADKVIEWLKTHGNLVPTVTIRTNEVIAKFKKDFGL